MLYCIFSNDDSDFEPQNENTVDIEMLENDTWVIQSLYELQYFNCPGCSYKSKSKQEVIDHLYEEHPEGLLTLRNIKDDSLREESSMKLSSQISLEKFYYIL